MTQELKVTVPDIGDFTDVEIIEIAVAVGDAISKEDSLITIETEKAAMDVPSPADGEIIAVHVAEGGKVSQGDLIVTLKVSAVIAADKPAATPSAPADKPAASFAAAVASEYDGTVDAETKLLVLGAGPGGYTSAFRAADLGLDVTLVERWPMLGGVCLNVGCIPSKALLHAAAVIEEADAMATHGVKFGKPEINIDELRDWKNSVVQRLVGGLGTLAKQRKVKVVNGLGEFLSPHHIKVSGEDGDKVIAFEQCIIAAGSEPAKLASWPEDPRIVDSTGALELSELPKNMLVIGGGIIGLEMATIYAALGVEISVVELTDGFFPGCDPDLVRPLEKRIKARYKSLMKGTMVTGMAATDAGIVVSFEGKNAPDGPQTYERVLTAIGRSANGDKIAADKAGVKVTERGIIPVDKQMRTNVPHIFAIGDIVGDPMLAHKATYEAKVAAEVAAGEKRAFDARVIPSVAYTDPEVSWVGVTETQAKKDGIKYEKAVFPWAASGRSLALGREEGFTKLLFDPSTDRVIGAGIVGTNAGELIAEVALAIEMGCDAADIGMTIHAHPTLSESVAMAAEAFEGTLTDLYMPKKK
ncbi:dihydrolipoyl dehydrogenase [Gammaproteobacteria bacterium]|nr:dihydrolipoyl dehydrogenase [Gammaproteobacteria bacterium]